MAASIHVYTLKRGKARTKQATSLTFDELEYFVAAGETSEARTRQRRVPSYKNIFQRPRALIKQTDTVATNFGSRRAIVKV
jgi:hypothetical protein